MGQNIIYYGPPGTGKTFLLQKICEDYTDYEVSDEGIRTAYEDTSLDWLVLSLIILQNNNNPLSSDEIAEKNNDLSLIQGSSISPILEDHSVPASNGVIDVLGLSSEPKIFVQSQMEQTFKWTVDLNSFQQYNREYYEKYIIKNILGKRYEFITFHQSLVYEDFIEGIRPTINSALVEEGSIKYSVQEGVFKRLCSQAAENPYKQYAVIIDEINRGNISEIFGELISLIETDKRIGEENELKITLPYSKTEFGVPQNVNIYATMNSTDRSIALIDFALRRRFEFIKFTCDLEELKNYFYSCKINPEDIDGINLIILLEIINKRIEYLLDSNYQIGHAYFMEVRNFIDIKNVILKKVIPLLEEYFHNDLQKIQIVFNDLDENGDIKDSSIYQHEVLSSNRLFSFTGDYSFEDKKRYFVNSNFDINAVIKIYTS